jgi:hypothetical protein
MQNLGIFKDFCQILEGLGRVLGLFVISFRIKGSFYKYSRCIGIGG